jgi:hypothetical protein
LAGQLVRIVTATAVVASSVLIIEKDDARVAAQSPVPGPLHLHMLTRNMRIEADLVDQPFNSSEDCPTLAGALRHANPSRMLPKSRRRRRGNDRRDARA